MAFHRITASGDDFYTGAAGLSEDQLQALLPVLSNDPRGAVLYSISAAVPHGLGGRTTNTPRLITILDDGITYSGFASISNGRINLDFSQSSTAIQALGSGDLLTGSFYYTARLSNGQYDLAKVTFTIRGTADTATITGDAVGDVREDGTLSDGGTLSVSDPDAGENLFQSPGSLAGIYGDFTFNAATGAWGYTLRNGDANVQSLGGSTTVQDTLNVASFDGSDTQAITVTIHGTNDPAAFFGNASSIVFEDLGSDAAGLITVTDPDAGEASFQTPLAAALVGTYGDFTFDPATGVWGYTLRNGDANVQALTSAGPSASDTLVVKSADGTTKTISVQIVGRDDAANITGQAAGDVFEDGVLTDGGTLSANDPDSGQNRFQAPLAAALAGTYGDFTFNDATGVWGYTLRNGDSNVQGLHGSSTVQDTLGVTSLDGSDSQTITVTIKGKDDKAVITGNDTGEVYEDGTLTDGGTLTVTDPDSGESHFQTPLAADLAGAYGNFTFNAATGVWGYTLINTGLTQTLGLGDVDFDRLDVISADGSALRTITVAIIGNFDPASITGNTDARVAEDGTLTAAGTLSVSDIDAGENKFQTPASLARTYGDFTFNANTGAWGYTLRNGDANVQALVSGQHVADTLSVTSLDGSDTETITIAIDGADDVANVGGDTAGDVTEDGTLTDGGTLSANDPDSGQDKFQTPLNTALAGTYGDFTFDPVTGVWGYTLRNSDTNVQSLGGSTTVQDTLSVTSFDGSDTQAITVTIHGTNDIPDLGGDDDRSTRVGDPNPTGMLTITDIDTGESSFQPLNAVPGENGLGTFTLAADGTWSFDLDETHPRVLALGPESIPIIDVINVYPFDNTPQGSLLVYIFGAFVT